MNDTRMLRIGTARTLLLAAVLGFLCALPSLTMHVSSASAQVTSAAHLSYAASSGTVDQSCYYFTSGCYGGTTCSYGTSCYNPYGTTCSYGTSCYNPYGTGTTCTYGTSCYNPYGTTCSYGTSCYNPYGTGTTCSYGTSCYNPYGTTCSYGTSCYSGCSYSSVYGCNGSCGTVGGICNSTCGVGTSIYSGTSGCGGCSGGFSIACPGANYNTGCTAYAGGICPTSSVYGAGASCISVNLAAYGAGATCSNGQIFCGGNTPLGPGGTCNGGITATTGAGTSCIQYSSSTGQCVSYAPQISAVTTPSTTGCAQYSTTTGQCIAPTTTGATTTPSTLPTNTAATNTCTGGTFTTGSGCSASSIQQTCPGSGITITLSGNQTLAQACPVVCYTAGAAYPAINPPGSTCPAGTTSTPSAASTTTPTPTTTPTTSTTPATTTTSPTTTAATLPTAATTGVAVNFPAGWSIAGGPTGTTVTGAGPTMYTLQAGDSGNYENLSGGSQFKSGEGYWVYLPTATTVYLPTVASGSLTVQLPAGQAVMIGNGGNSVATVSGMDSLTVWDPAAQTWTQTTSLQAGQGGFATSTAGGQATITWGSAVTPSGSAPAAPAS